MKTRTMKVAAIALFAAMFATTASAQSIKYPKMHFGIRVGGTFNSISTTGLDNINNGEYKDKVKGKTFVTGGLALDFRIASVPLYLETGAYFVSRTAVIKKSDYTTDADNNGVQVPLLLSYHYYIADNVAIQPFVGGYGSYGNEFGAGVRAGVGINYGRLYANVGYDFDLTERKFETGEWPFNSSSYDCKYKSPGLFATIGFNFGGSR